MRNILLLLVLMAPLSSLAQFVWNGHGDGFSWGDKDNWVGDVAPGANMNETVTINDANQTVIVSDTRTVGYLNVIGSTLEVATTGILNVAHTASSSLPDTRLIDLQNATLILNGRLNNRSIQDDFIIELDGNSTFRVGASGYHYTWLTIKGIYINSGSTYEVLAGGEAKLTMDSMSVTNFGTVNNLGKIDITHSSYGFNNYGLIINEDSLKITGTFGSKRGLYSTDSVNNQGYLFVSGVDEYALFNSGGIHNQSGGLLEIYRYASESSAPAGSESFHNEGLFQNDGELLMNSFTEFGVYNSADFINTNLVDIGTADSLGFVNIGAVGDTSLLQNTGRMDIHGNRSAIYNNAAAKVLWQGKGELTGGYVLDNLGYLEMTDSLTIEGTTKGFINSGIAQIDGPLTLLGSNFGLENQGKMEVGSSGHIYSGLMTTTFGSYALKNSGTFTNGGLIDITHGARGLLNASLQGFTNNGTLNIHNLSLIFLDNEGVTDSSYFVNNGFLNIGTTPTASPGSVVAGLYNQTKGKFTNNGSMDFSQLYQNFNGINNAGVFLQNGDLEIDQMEEVFIDNSGRFTCGSSSNFLADCSLNWLYKVLVNTGEFYFDGYSEFTFDHSYARNFALIENNDLMECRGTLFLNSEGGTAFFKNTDQLTVLDTLLLMNSYQYVFDNTGDVLIETSAYIKGDTVGGMKAGQSFVHKGVMELSVVGNLFDIGAGETIDNQGEIYIQHGQNVPIIKLTDATATLQNTGVIEIDGGLASGLVNPGTVLLTNGQINNQGTLRISSTEDPAIRVDAGSLINDDTLDVAAAQSLQLIYLNGGQLTNNGFFRISGAGEDNASLLLAKSATTVHNNGTIEIIDAFNSGLQLQGLFTTTANSEFLFTNNTRNTGNLLSHTGSTPVVYNGSMKATNAQNCVAFSGAAQNNGFLDLGTCSISMAGGTNNSGGHIISKDLSYIGQNDGVVEFLTTDAFSLIGTDVITNNGVMVDHGDAFRNIKFHDGGALGFPVWNKGLFVSPFYGTLSDGIKEVVNLNYTETGSLPISDDWYTDRAKTTVAGTWHQSDHHYTPNAAAVGADSIFFEVNMTGSNPIVLSVPVILPTSCPLPEIVRIFQPVVDRNLVDHTVWRGNRAPDYCHKIQLSGNEGFYLPSGYKMEVNSIEIAPQTGPDRWVEIETGAVFEVNVLGFE
ncbi:hypothetical protein [Jiulongibacter sediminis]|nr:hypothetical protein [Jiulongibacter sediminis]